MKLTTKILSLVRRISYAVERAEYHVIEQEIKQEEDGTITLMVKIRPGVKRSVRAPSASSPSKRSQDPGP